VYIEVSELWQHIEGQDLLRQTLCDEIYAESPLPRKRAARSRCQTRLGLSPINRTLTKSAATGSSARTIFPRCR